LIVLKAGRKLVKNLEDIGIAKHIPTLGSSGGLFSLTRRKGERHEIAQASAEACLPAAAGAISGWEPVPPPEAPLRSPRGFFKMVGSIGPAAARLAFVETGNFMKKVNIIIATPSQQTTERQRIENVEAIF